MFSVKPVANPPQPAQGVVYINNQKVGKILFTEHNAYTTQTIAIPVASKLRLKVVGT